jgi:catechol 2,3-dioxygenase-like lactoylglutathione lyase family enzyme
MTTIKRIVPDIKTSDLPASRAFYTDVLGLEVAMDMDFIVTLVSPNNRMLQISLVGEEPSGLTPQVSIEVGDVDAVHSRAVSCAAEIIYPLTTEPWGVRRFFVKDPNGTIINVLSHTR